MASMSLPRVVAVTPASPAARAGLQPGDEFVTLNGQVPRDVIQYQLLVDEPDLELEIRRGGLETTVVLDKNAGEPLGVEVDAAIFDRVRTCDNHCEFCFIYQLPKGLRPSLYLKDDDYRLSFLYGNFTTLTRFTEADLERVVTERLSPLYVSIHATDPDVRARMLRNRRGAMSLRWLGALLDHGIEVHGQVVVCPGVNDGAVFEDTLAGVLDQYPGLASVAAVPLGVSRYTTESDMRTHTEAEAAAIVDAIDEWQPVFLDVLGRRMIFAADEYYLLANRDVPDDDSYESYAQLENGVGMIRRFVAEWQGHPPLGAGHARGGFFQWVEGAPAEGYRAPRAPVAGGEVRMLSPADAPVAIVTGEYGARVLAPLVASLPGVRVVAVRNEFFGGNTSVAGLMVGEDIRRVLSDQPVGDRYLLPDVCLSNGTFLDGTTIADLGRPVEVVPADGASLRKALRRRAA